MLNNEAEFLTEIRSTGADRLLSKIEVFAHSRNEPRHLSKVCADGKPRQENLLDAKLIFYCRDCNDSGRKVEVMKLEKELNSLKAFIHTLLKLERAAENVSIRALNLSRDLGFELYYLHKNLPGVLNRVEECNVFEPLTSSLLERKDAAEQRIIEFLRTFRHKDIILNKYGNPKADFPLYANAVLVCTEALSRTPLAAVYTYGELLKDNIFLVRAPRPVLAALASDTISSPLYAPKDLSVEVLQALVTLWEPDSESALGDAMKALQVAQEFTPVDI